MSNVSIISNELKELENLARKAAIDGIEKRFSKVDDLDRLDQDIKRSIKKKEEYDSQLKTAVDSQLLGIKSGLGILKSAQEEIECVQSSLNSCIDDLSKLHILRTSIASVKEEYKQHNRLTTAISNLSYVLNASENIKKIYYFLDTDNTNHTNSNSNLLNAHYLLQELEKSRDGLMFELYRSSKNKENDADLQLLRTFFKDVPEISDNIWTAVNCTFKRLLDTIIQDPELLVTCVRIVDREQRLDDLWEEKQKKYSFEPISRPKQWKTKLFSTISESIHSKFEGSLAETSEQTENWLENHFIMLQKFINSDLLIAKKLCPTCFPANYNVFDFYLSTYHSAVTSVIELYATKALGNEMEFKACVALLKWIETLKNTFDDLGKKVFFDPNFSMTPYYQEPHNFNRHFLNDERFIKLSRHSLDLISKQISAWFSSALDKEKHTWYQCTSQVFHPEKDLTNDTFYTHIISALTAIISEGAVNVGVTLPIMARSQLSIVIINNVITFLKSYSQAMRDFRTFVKAEVDQQKKTFLQDSFELILVSSMNNILKLIRNLEAILVKQTTDFEESLSSTLESQKSQLSVDCQNLAKEWSAMLADEICSYLQEHVFQKLLTKTWVASVSQSSTDPISAMEVTDGEAVLECVSDAHDTLYVNLFPELRNTLMHKISENVCLEYLRALFRNKPVLKGQQNFVASRLASDAKLLKDGFAKWNCRQDIWQSVLITAEILKADLSLVYFELSSILRNFPDLRQDQLEAIIMMRGDCSSREAADLTSSYYTKEEIQRREPNARKFFSYIKK